MQEFVFYDGEFIEKEKAIKLLKDYVGKWFKKEC